MNRSVLRSTVFVLTFLIGVVAIFSCNHHEKIVENDYPNLVMDSTKSDGFGADVQFSIVKKIEKDTSVIYTLQAAFKEKLVGFTIEVPKITDKNKNGYGDGVVITTNGQNSDDFINVLAGLYKLKVDTTKKFIRRVRCVYVDLDQFAKSVAGTPTDENAYYKTLKLFFDAPGGDEAEVFFNIDSEQKRAELVEKDPDYRTILIDVLTQSGKS